MKLLITIFLLFVVHAAVAEVRRGVYEVPEPKGISYDGLNRFPILIDYDPEEPSFSYDLPLVLTGTRQTVTLYKTFESEEMVGWHGSYGPSVFASCKVGENVCRVDYSNLVIDKEKVEEAIRDLTNVPSQQDLLRQVSEHFQSEPIGILTFY